MSFQGRLILLITGLVALTSAVLSAALIWASDSALKSRFEADGRLTVAMLAHAAVQTQEIPRDLEVLMGHRLISEATLAAHLVASLEAAKVPQRQINDQLRKIAETGGPAELWIADQRGRSSLRSVAGPERLMVGQGITSGQGGVDELLRGAGPHVGDAVAQAGRIMKYGAVGGVDRPRIVQVGADISGMADIARKVGVEGMIDALLATRQVDAAWLLDREARPLARGAVMGEAGGAPLSEDAISLAKSMTVGSPVAVLWEGPYLLALTPLPESASGVMAGGIAAVRLAATDAGRAMSRELKIAGLLSFLALIAALAVAMRFARRQMAPIERLGEAVAAVEAGRFNPLSLNEATERTDEMGRLARVFRTMAMEATAREETLDAQLLLRTAEFETASDRLNTASQILDEELRAARDVQSNLLPRIVPAHRDSQMHALLLPGPVVSGDFYDLIELDERQSLIAVVSVSGAGVPAAFLMLLVRSAIRELARPGMSPATILAGANDRLCGQSPFDGFASMGLLIYDRETGDLRHAQAGNILACLIRVDGTPERLGDAGGPALGVRRGAPYGEATMTLAQDETVLICPDSLLRVVGEEAGDAYGEQRLATLLHQSGNISARERVEAVLRSVSIHAGANGLLGDLLCVALRRLLPTSANSQRASDSAVSAEANGPVESSPADSEDARNSAVQDDTGQAGPVEPEGEDPGKNAEVTGTV